MSSDQWSSRAVFGELVLGMHEIAQVHDLEDEAVWSIAGLLNDLFDAHVWRRCRNEQRSRHAMARELVVGMCEIISTHDLGDKVVGHFVKILDGLLETDPVFDRARQASVRELLDDLFAISRGDLDEEPPTPGELLDDLLVKSLERRRKKQKPRHQGPHPAMVELLARLDRFSTDHDDAEDAASTSAN
jgi:hypothetical protein